MSADGPLRLTRAILWLRLLLVGGFMVGIGIAAMASAARGDWERHFIPAGVRMRLGQDIFDSFYVYPPFQAFVAALVTLLPPLAGDIVWALLNSIAGAVFLLGAWRLSGGAAFWRNDPVPARENWIFVSGFAAAAGFIFDVITNGQTDLILAALIVGGCVALQRSSIGGALIGVAAAAKCTPLLFLPWLAWNRRWMAAAALLVATVVLNVAPDVFFPEEAEGLRVGRWARNYLGSLFQPNYVPGTWFTGVEFNHSLAGGFKRLLPAAAAGPLWLAASAALVLSSAIVLTRGHRDGRVDIAVILCLMVLLSPISSKPHFCVLLLPAWIVAREAIVSRDRLVIAASFLSALMGVAANKDLVGSAIYDALKWSGVITAEALLLCITCLWIRWRGSDVLAGGRAALEVRR